MTISLRALAPVAATLLLATSCVSTERETATSSKDPRAEFTPPRGRGERVGAATVLNTVRGGNDREFIKGVDFLVKEFTQFDE